MPEEPDPSERPNVVPIDSYRRAGTPSAKAARRGPMTVPGRWGWDRYGPNSACRNDVDCPPDKICEHGRCV